MVGRTCRQAKCEVCELRLSEPVSKPPPAAEVSAWSSSLPVPCEGVCGGGSEFPSAGDMQEVILSSCCTRLRRVGRKETRVTWGEASRLPARSVSCEHPPQGPPLTRNLQGAGRKAAACRPVRSTPHLPSDPGAQRGLTLPTNDRPGVGQIVSPQNPVHQEPRV